MSNPSFSNIDLWLFELAEGNLSSKQIEQLELFLLQNPEIDVDRDVWEMAKVGKKSVAFPDEEKLIKKRPVGWYIVGSLALTSVIALLWYFVPQINGQHDLVARNTDRKEVRVFVINKDPNRVSTSVNETNVVFHQTAEFNPTLVESGNPDLMNQNAFQANDIQDVSENVRGVQSSYSSIGMQDENIITGFSEIQNEQTELSGNNETDQLIANNGIESGVEIQEHNLGTEELSFTSYDVNSLPIIKAQQVNLNEQPDPSTMVINNEQVIFQEEVTAHHLSEYESKTENFNGHNTNAHQTFSSGYRTSFKSKLNVLGRRIQRMMDNPVALKNFKDPHFHVPGMLPTDINFSSTGTMLSARVQTLSRMQWMGQENEQLMNQLSFDGYAYSIRGGIGLQLNHGLYRSGGVSVAGAAITYSPKISISRQISVEPSLRFKMGNKTLANSKMQGVSQVEIDRGNDLAFYPEKVPIGKMLWYQDLGVGLMVNTEWFYAGIQVDNLFRHYDNIYDVNIESARRSPNHFVATVGTDWVSRKENLSLSPYIVYQNYGDLSEAWAGANFRMSWFTLGASVSSALEPAASIGLKFDHFALTYNADYTKSVMTGTKSLSHQLSLRFVSKPSRFGKRLLNL